MRDFRIRFAIRLPRTPGLRYGGAYRGLGRIFDPFVTYVVRFQEPSLASANTGDELDAGIEVNLEDLYKLQVAYVAANLAGPHRASHMCFVELRVVLGSQLP